MKKIEVGRGRKIADGSQVTVLSIGTISDEVSKAIRIATDEGISVCHYDMIFLKPLDNTILEAVANSGTPIVTVEDASEKGGLGSAVLEWLSSRGIARDVRRIGIPDKFVPHGTVTELRDLCGIGSKAIYNAIIESINPNAI